MTQDSSEPFVPVGFEPPAGLEAPQFRLRPLGPEHNVSDYAAWTSSMEHIHATPGWGDGTWPRPMTLEENRGDLERHAADFANRAGFTYTVLAPDSDKVIGCVYIYPAKQGGGAKVLSWVRADSADLDAPLYEAVSAWLARDWLFDRVAYAPRYTFPAPDTALTHILVVSDPAQSKAWYTDVLGASIYREYGSSIVLSFGGAWLLLVEGGGPTDDKPGVTLAPPTDPDLRDNLFTIRVDLCQATYELLLARGGTFLTPPVSHGSETRCFLRDPDGHLFELSEYRAT